MMTKNKTINYVWATQAIDEDCKFVDCRPNDPILDFHRDPSGYYVLIRPDFTTRNIEVAICNKAHVIQWVFKGKSAVDVYEGIFAYEKKHQRRWFLDKGHAAYLGKELKKAEIALTLGQNNYFQE